MLGEHLHCGALVAVSGAGAVLLFDPYSKEVAAMTSDAVLSPLGLYRCRLSRTWDDAGEVCAFIMLNPSTADATQDDPTIRRCIGFAKAWGYGSLVVGNIFAFRATDPRAITVAFDPVGPDNALHLDDIAQDAEIVLCAWGGGRGNFRGQGREVLERFKSAGHDPKLHYLSLTKGGQPKHPLYLPRSLRPIRMEERAR